MARMPRLLLLLMLASTAFAADAAERSVRIVAINDFHGHLEPDASAEAAGGALALAATLARLRAEVPDAIFVSSGDLIGASPLPSALAHDEPTLALFGRLGLAANAIGNHELDHGVVELRRQQALAEFPFLSANLVDIARGEPVFAPYRIVEPGGVRIALVGATVGNALKPLDPDSVPGLRLDEEAAALNAQAARLRAGGIETFIALLHEGAGAQDAIIPAEGCQALSGRARAITEALDPGYALVLSAHTHGRYACRVGGRWLLQAGSYGRYLAVADLRIADGKVVAVSVREVPVRSEAGQAADAAVGALVADAVAAAAKIADAPVAKLADGRVSATDDGEGGSPLGRMVARAQLEAARAQGAELACTNPSSVPRTLVASLPGGVASYADVRAVQPYGNRLQLRRVDGARLRTLLEQQWRAGGATIQLSCSPGLEYHADAAHRVLAGSLRLHGRVVRDEDAILMVVNSYLARGGQGFGALEGAPHASDAGGDLDALLAWLRRNLPTESSRK
jgi:5'-nucleotidase